MQIRSKAYLQMNIATFLWGLTAILGKVISIGEFPLVWYRVFFVSIVMLFIPTLIPNIKKLNRKTVFILAGIGILLVIHWVAWYGSIKYANASVAVSCIAAVSLFVAILEPILNKTKFEKSNLILGFMVIPGILLINQSLEIESYKFGFLLGILAAFLAALFNIFNKKYTQDIEPNIITFVQMFSGFIFLTLCLPFYIKYSGEGFHLPDFKDFIFLLILSVFCTVIPYNLFLRALKASNAFTTSLINNLEPVYGIILAVILLQENKQLNWKFYLGTTVILSAVFIHAYLSNKSRTKSRE
ncbi:MAG TPA: DMT family transporter [Chitinophagales bacterium]|nr:DMT family transporter [Chitinophagales bacterium]